MSDDLDAPPRGRLLLVTGADAPAVGRLARVVGERLRGAVVVDGQVLDAMVVGDPAADGVALLRRQLLRWSAGLAFAETYLMEGHDVVVADRVEGDRLDDYLDLATPEPVHLVVVGDGIDPSTPSWGLWVTRPAADDDTATLARTADEVVERLEESVVVTAATD